MPSLSARKTAALSLIVSLCWISLASAQPQPSGKQTSAEANAACQKDVLRFEQAIAFARNAQGTAAAAQLKERLLPAKIETDLMYQEGYCGLARYLREKKLID